VLKTKIVLCIAVLFAASDSLAIANSDIDFNGLDPSQPIAGQITLSDALLGVWRAETDSPDAFTLEQGSLNTEDGLRLRVEPTGNTLSVDLNIGAGPLAGLTQPDGHLIIGQPLYYSFLAKASTANSDNSQGYLAIAGDNEFSFVVGQTWGSEFFSNSEGAPSEFAFDSEIHRFVIKITRFDWGTQADVYIDPEPGVIEQNQTIDMQGWPSKEDSPAPKLLRLEFKANGNAWHFDDIMFGDTFDSVFP